MAGAAVFSSADRHEEQETAASVAQTRTVCLSLSILFPECGFWIE
jgi:hypothetical protein